MQKRAGSPERAPRGPRRDYHHLSPFTERKGKMSPPSAAVWPSWHVSNQGLHACPRKRKLEGKAGGRWRLFYGSWRVGGKPTGLQTGSLHMIVLPATIIGQVSVLKTLARPTKGRSHEP